MCCNDKGFVNELSKEMNVTEADAEFILMSQGVVGLYNRRRRGTEEAEEQARALLAVSTCHEDSRESGEKLWTANYMLDIAINFFVYVVHYQLMLWSTSYAINTWQVSISTAGLLDAACFLYCSSVWGRHTMSCSGCLAVAATSRLR